MRAIILTLIVLFLTSLTFAERTVSIDIYNRDQALIQEIRSVGLEKGLNSIDFTEISDGIYGNTIRILPHKHKPDIETVSIAFKYDLLTHSKLIRKFIGRWFTFESEDMVYQGRLLRIDDNNIFLQTDTTDQVIEVVERAKLTEMFYPGIPEGLVTKPTIRWICESDMDYENIPVEISYLTSDITWLCDYRAELSGQDAISLSGIFLIDNQLPLDFENVSVALVAGETHRSFDPDEGDGFRINPKPGLSTDKETGGFSVFHRYPLKRKIDVEGSQSIQIPFFESKKIDAEKRYVFPHTLEDQRVVYKIRLKNTAENGLGMPLPEGAISIYSRTEEGDLSFIGEDYFTSIPEGKEMDIVVGNVFDVSASRTRIGQARPQRDKHEETWKIDIINNQDTDIVVYVEQRVYGYYVIDLMQNSDDIKYEQESSEKVVFPASVQSNAKREFLFTIRYGY